MPLPLEDIRVLDLSRLLPGGFCSQPQLERPVRVVGPPVKFSRTPADPHRRPAPALGEHTDEVLAEVGFKFNSERGLTHA